MTTKASHASLWKMDDERQLAVKYSAVYTVV